MNEPTNKTGQVTGPLETVIPQVWRILGQVTDPEIPALSVVDLGIVRNILCASSSPANPATSVAKEQAIEVIITPTYSGCPAMDVIATNIKAALWKNGFQTIRITQQLSPAWTTDWITKEGRNKLKAYGIAPPQTPSDGSPSDGPSSAGPGPNRRVHKLFTRVTNVECPQCRSTNTKLLSQFGSTACKALYQCEDCREPFDYFKCH